MTSELHMFHFDNDCPGFEDLGRPNGVTLWTEEVVMQALGYQTRAAFGKAVLRAKQTCLSLQLQCEEHFVLQPDGSHIFTRFGCYLVAMNGDPRKPEVAAAQNYFATLAQTFQSYHEHADAMDRLLIREEVTDGQKSLASTAKRHGIVHYGFFQNKGYMGMYNMSLKNLNRLKGVPKGENLIDRMGRTELAAHLFRITQTDEKIKNDRLVGQQQLEQAAADVGKTVRRTMIELSSTRPEQLPAEENIRNVRKKIKGTSRKFKSLDRRKKRP